MIDYGEKVESHKYLHIDYASTVQLENSFPITSLTFAADNFFIRYAKYNSFHEISLELPIIDLIQHLQTISYIKLFYYILEQSCRLLSQKNTKDMLSHDCS